MLYEIPLTEKLYTGKQILEAALLSIRDRNDRFEMMSRLIAMKSAKDVRPVKEGENITENNPVDEFVCSKCGIILEDWSRVEIDEDDGERTNHEYVFRFCPNCGAKMGGEPDGT